MIEQNSQRKIQFVLREQIQGALNSPRDAAWNNTALPFVRCGWLLHGTFLVYHGCLSVCLDGSPPSYYFRRGHGSGASHWVVHFQVMRCDVM